MKLLAQLCSAYSEVLRVLDSLQLTMYKKVATPANWTPGSECMVLPSVSKDEAAKLFPQHRVADVSLSCFSAIINCVAIDHVLFN